MAQELTAHEATAQALAFAVTDEDGAALNLTGFALTIAIAEWPGEEPVATKTTDDGVTITTAASGLVSLTLAADDIPQRRIRRHGRYEVQLHPGDDLDADPTRRITGSFIILPSIA